MPRVCITVTGKNAQPYRFSLDRKVVRLGRASDNDIVIDCPSVSSHHCEMRRIEGGYILKDLDSTNGIKLDGDRMTIIDLSNGQEVEVGDAHLDFELTKEERSDLAEEDHKPRQQAKLPSIEDEGESEDEDRDRKSKSKATARPKPKPKSKPPQRRPTPAPAQRQPVPLPSATQAGGGTNFMVTMGFLFLAILAFYLGLAIKHSTAYPSRDYPQSKGLLGDILSKENTLQKRQP